MVNEILQSGTELLKKEKRIIFLLSNFSRTSHFYCVKLVLR